VGEVPSHNASPHGRQGLPLGTRGPTASRSSSGRCLWVLAAVAIWRLIVDPSKLLAPRCTSETSPRHRLDVLFTPRVAPRPRAVGAFEPALRVQGALETVSGGPFYMAPGDGLVDRPRDRLSPELLLTNDSRPSASVPTRQVTQLIGVGTQLVRTFTRFPAASRYAPSKALADRALRLEAIQR